MYSKTKEYGRLNQKKWRSKPENSKKIKDDKFINFEKHIIYRLRQSAKRKCMDMNLSVEDIVIPDFCPYLGIKLTKIMNSGIILTNPSIDRIDNKKGYIKGNIRVVSHLANTMKSNVDEAQLLIFAKNIIKIHSK